MDSHRRKTLKTSRGLTYTYYVSESPSSKPTLLLQHGFPDDACMWKGIASKLTRYRLVVPDLLGYSGTSKPTEPSAYSYAYQAQDLLEILDAEGIEKVISVGHDFGAVVAQRFYNYNPTRVEAVILLNVGYLLPSADPPNLEKSNAHLEKLFGYPALAYQEFFIADEASALLNANPDRLYQAMHSAPKDWMKETWCTRGNIRKWLQDKTQTVELLGYAQDPALRQAFVERFRRDGFEGPLCYYKATNSNVQYDASKDIKKQDLVVRVPMLYIACTRDPVCRPEFMIPAKEGGFLPDLEEAVVDSGHWCPLESPNEVAELMISFLERRFGP
ncbi:alpha/beta-hydrolase [Hypoxylon fuscum]|nr:alpha/beta-hydrolase [Hypoxylon fuscum]